MPNRSAHGRFAWHELSTTDPTAAESFYTQVTPWKTQPWEMADDYTVCTNDGQSIGGITRLDDRLKSLNVPPHWMPYVSVYDVDACLHQVPKIGGQVRIGPKEIPNVGCWAVIADPHGASLGMFEPETTPLGHAGTPRRGEFSWHELATTDFKAAFDFYRALFQWEKTGEFDMGQMGTYFMYGQRGQTYGGMFNKPPEIPVPHWLCYIRVDDVKQSAEQVARAGGTVENGPMEVPSGAWILQGMDPQGAAFALHTPKAA